MLHHVNKVRLGAFVAPSFLNVRHNLDGSVEEFQEPSNKSLPKPETTDIEALTKSGIPVKQTKTRILRSKRKEQIAQELEDFEESQQQTNK